MHTESIRADIVTEAVHLEKVARVKRAEVEEVLPAIPR